QVDGGPAGHLGARRGVLPGDGGGGVAAFAFHQVMGQAPDIEVDLGVAPLGADQVGHLDGLAAAVDAVGGHPQVGRDLADDVAHHRSRQHRGVVAVGVVGVVQHDIDQDLGVVGGQHRHEGGRLFVVAVGAPVHVQQLGSARLAADAVARHIGAVAAAAGGAVAHLVLHDLADGLAGAAADDLAADARPDLLHHVAVG